MLAPLLLAATLGSAAPAELPADQRPIDCGNCAAWNAARAPFRLFGHSYYVGVDGLASVLIDSGDGLILLDGGLPQSAALIAANIERLGFDVADVKWIAVSHAHYDHVGGVAALARISGAKVAASAAAADALRAGTATGDDPQAGYGREMDFPAVERVEEIADAAAIALGRITLTAHYTPGHTPGGTSWSWRDCEGEHCVDLVYADSLNAISHEDFKFGAEDGARVVQFRRSIERVRVLRCELLVSAHPSLSQLFERAERDELIDAQACQVYADAASQRLDQRLTAEANSAAD